MTENDLLKLYNKFLDAAAADIDILQTRIRRCEAVILGLSLGVSFIYIAFGFWMIRNAMGVK